MKDAEFYGGSRKEYWQKQNGGLSHRKILKADIDTALAQSANFKAFETRLKDMGYEICRGENFAHYSVKGTTGNRNTGDWNTGNRNTGDWNTGNRNTGNRNTGDWNKSSCNTGCFMTEEPKISLFNEPSDWSHMDWWNSEARQLLNRIPKGVVEWICSEDMTDTPLLHVRKAVGGVLYRVADDEDVRFDLPGFPGDGLDI